MNHKLQVPSFTNDGAKTVGRADTTSEIANNDAGSASRSVADCVPNEDSPQDSQLSEIAGSVVGNEFDAGNRSVTESPHEQEISTELSAASVARDQNEPQDQAQPHSQEQTQPAQAIPQLLQPLRCEVARSVGYDPTGEYAVPCGALAQVVCEYCGLMCSSCAEETFCFQGEHKLTTLPDDKPRAKHKRRGPVVEVVYVEIKCPKCKSVRLALPKKHTPKAMRKCPICKTLARAEYLAHGFTRRRLPYHEVFETELVPSELTVLPDGTRRLPWDTRHWAGYKDR